MEFAFAVFIIFVGVVWIYARKARERREVSPGAPEVNVAAPALTPAPRPLDGPPYVETAEDRARRSALNKERHRNFLSDDSDDERFERIFQETFGSIVDHWFYSKVAGSKHRNSDGTSRAKIIAACGVFEMLELVPEPDNCFDPNAQMILRHPNGEQLGYVDARAAMEITRDEHRGRKWFAVLKNHNFHPETGRVVGANLVLARLSEEVVQKSIGS